jgi:hypothetical protein
METKGFKIVGNTKIIWISIIFLNKVVLEKFKTLLVKMAQVASTHETTKTNYVYLCDLDTILKLTSMVSLLEVVKGLSKYVQNPKTFIYDFVTRVKLCQANFHNMYCDDEKKYNYINFPKFCNFIDHNSNVLHIVWWNNPTISVMPFFSKAKMYNMHKTCKLTGIHTKMTHEDWVEPMQDVKTQSIQVTI